MDFDAAVAAHLAAVTGRDLDAYLATVHDEVTVVLPNGKLLSGRDEVGAFHRDWFADPDWRMDTTPVSTAVTGDTAVTVLAVAYHDVDAAGAAYRKDYLLSLVFARRDGRWLLVHDQNTFC